MKLLRIIRGINGKNITKCKRNDKNNYSYFCSHSYFNSINPDILMTEIQRKIKDKEVLDTSVKIDKKAEAIYKIEKEVFDEKDSLADTAKWTSLLTTLVSTMYYTFTETQKAKIPAEQRSLIEYTFAKFKTTNTRGDIQFAQEGVSMVDKLLERQAKVGELVK